MTGPPSTDPAAFGDGPEQADVAVLASRLRWEEKQILEALERRDVPYVFADPRAMTAPKEGLAPSWRLALNREIGQTRALYAAMALESGGVRIINSSDAIEVCSDKWRTALALEEADLTTPQTTLALTPDAAREAAEELGYPLVIKPLTGSWGRRIAMVRDADAADAVLEHTAALPAPQARVVCLQEPVETAGRDIRVLVVGGEPLGAVYRIAEEGWRTNVALGSETRPCRLSDRLARLAVQAAEATGAEIAGVDVLEGEDDELFVLEVNAGVEFRGFARATEIDVAGAIVDYLTYRLP